MAVYRSESEILKRAKMLSDFFFIILLSLVVFFVFEIEHYSEGNQYLLSHMMKEFALLIILLCLELILFVRFHLYFSMPKLKILKNQKLNHFK